MITFEPFPKLSRISRGCVITEKLDGTNAQIIIERVGEYEGFDVPGSKAVVAKDGGEYRVAAGSRTRLITPGKLTDNSGFAAWVWDNAQELVELGIGRHFGEWWGKGIQRGYGMSERRFSLFDTHKWPAVRPRPACVYVVPILHRGEFTDVAIANAMVSLSAFGSFAVPVDTPYMNPEGIVIFHEAAKVSFKKTFDDKHKEAA